MAFYTAVNLLAGDYKVTISAKGFNTEAKTESPSMSALSKHSI